MGLFQEIRWLFDLRHPHDVVADNPVSDKLEKTGDVKGFRYRYVQCAEECKKCRSGRCTRQSGHNSFWHGHESRSDTEVQGTRKKGCGHSWDD